MTSTGWAGRFATPETTRFTRLLVDRRLARAMTVAGWVVALALWVGLVVTPHFADAMAYYRAGVDDPYAIHLKTQQFAFIYSPAVTQILEPFRILPYEAFHAVVLGLELAALAYLAGRWLLLVLLIPWTFPDLRYANINFLVMAAAVIGLRYPATWALPLLTKVTPGIGVLWFAFRREWRSLGVALGSTAAIVTVSFVLAPGLWFEWVGVLRNNAATTMPALYIPIPLWARLASAVALLAWAAPRGHLWAVPVAVTLGTAWLNWPHLMMLVGVIPLVDPLRRQTVMSSS